MGYGLILKALVPLSLYITGIVCSLMAMGGNVRWAIMLIAFLLPLRNIIERVQPLPLGNQFIDILLGSVIIGWLVNTSAKNRPFFQKSSVNTMAVILAIYTLISTLLGTAYIHDNVNLGSMVDHRLQDWKNFCLLPIFFYVVLNNVQSKKDVWTLVGVMCLSMFFINLYTMQQIKWYSSLESRYKITATFQFLGPNEVAAFFNEYTILLMSVFYSMKKHKNKWLLFALILANLFCITFTYSRGAYAGFVVGLFFLFLVKDKKMLIPLLLVLALWQTALPEKVVARIKETKTETGKLDESSQRRIDIWHQALDLYKSNPLTGIGFGVFRYLGLDLGDTHNIYVKLLTEQGTIGFIIFVLVVFCFLAEGMRLYQKGDDDMGRGLGLGFLLCVIVMLVNNFFGDRWTYMEPNAYLWIFAALVARLNLLSKSPVQEAVYTPVPVKKSQAVPLTEKVRKKIRYYDLK